MACRALLKAVHQHTHRADTPHQHGPAIVSGTLEHSSHTVTPTSSPKVASVPSGFSIPPPILSSLTLRFRKEQLNILYNQREGVQQDVGLDSAVVALSPFALILFCSRQQPWDQLCVLPAAVLALLIIIWTWGVTAADPNLAKLYFWFRTPILLSWRLISIALLLHQFTLISVPVSKLPQPTAFCSKDWLHCAQLLLVSNSALPMMLQTLGLALPLWLHFGVVLVHLLLLLLVPTISATADLLCACHQQAVQSLYETFSAVAMVAQPFTGLATQGLSDVLMDGQCQVCPGRQIAAFMLLSVGVVIPCLVVYETEKRARLIFAMNHRHLLGDEAVEVQVCSTDQGWLSCFLAVVKACVLLALLWQLLECVYN